MKKTIKTSRLSDKDLNEIIDAPRPSTGNIEVHDVTIYFDTFGGTAKPSWKYMCPVRMRELFIRFLKMNLSDQLKEKIRLALIEIEAAR